MTTTGSTMQAVINPADLAVLYRVARQAEGEIQTELRRSIKKAAQPVVDGIRSEAASFSTRIPGTVKTKVSFARKSASVTVTVGARHAAPINNNDNAGTFRHPVFGTDIWVEQSAHPFLTSGARHGEPSADRAMLAVMDAIAGRLGFH